MASSKLQILKHYYGIDFVQKLRHDGKQEEAAPSPFQIVCFISPADWFRDIVSTHQSLHHQPESLLGDSLPFLFFFFNVSKRQEKDYIQYLGLHRIIHGTIVKCTYKESNNKVTKGFRLLILFI